jgi:hypothetical protein
MNHRLILSVLVGAAALVWRAAPASACDPASFDTSYDFADRAATVVVVKVDSLGKSTANVSRVETLKGSFAAAVTLDVDLASTCSTGMSAGEEGVIYLDSANRMIGLYDGFDREPKVIASVRAYLAGATAADKAVALADLAVSRDWSASYRAAYALANRADLVLALDTASRDRVVKRLAKVGEQHTLILVAARFHDARVKKLQKRRRFDSATNLAGVMAGAFDAATDPSLLADTIAAKGTSRSDRVAAMERCEQVRGFTLARFTDYAGTDEQAWSQLADACRSGTPIR